MSAAHKKKTITPESVTLRDDSPWRKVPAIGAIVGVLGVGATLALGNDANTNLYAYLTAFLFFLSIALGALFFVMIFFLTRSGWNVAIRRLAENTMVTLPVFALLFIPIALHMDTIFPWMNSSGKYSQDPLLELKSPYLNTTFFYLRAAFYFVSWTALSVYFYRRSVAQDKTGDHGTTRTLQAIAAPGIAVTALTLTFAAFDWNMSLEFHWFSTIFGIIYFAGGFMGCFALLAVLSIILMKQKQLGGAVTVEHLHGLGKMMFGMMAFWAYVSFSQLILIWYANIPETTMYYEARVQGTWLYVTILLALGHFLIPFFALMSHNVKRNSTALFIGAAWLLLMHYVDVYWMIMPSAYKGNAGFGLAEITAFVGIGGIFVGTMAAAMMRSPLVAVRDPRLPESLAFEN